MVPGGTDTVGPGVSTWGDSEGVLAVGAIRSVLRPLGIAMVMAALVFGSLASASATEETDTTPPGFTYKLSTLSTSTWTEDIAWGSKDDLSGVDHAVARWRSKQGDGTWSSWHRPLKWSDLPANASISKHFEAGYSYQIQALIVDKAGNRSNWTAVGGGVRPRS